MTLKIVTFKASHEEIERWRTALKGDLENTRSSICRAALDRYAEAYEKRQAKND